MNPVKKQKCGSFQVLLFCVLGLLWHADACISLKGEQRQVIDAREILNQQKNVANCLTTSLEKGNIGLARSILNVYDSQYEHLFSRVLEKELKRLKLMQQEIVLSESSCEPVIKWGQNESHIFLTMKMSHRWDSPPCLNTKRQLSRLNNNTFEFTNICVVSHSKITFNLFVEFYEKVKNEDIVVSRDGVGIYSTIIQKESDKIWPYLSKDEKTHQIWGEISERHNAVHKQYQMLLQQIDRTNKSKPVVLEEAKKETGQIITKNGQAKTAEVTDQTQNEQTELSPAEFSSTDVVPSVQLQPDAQPKTEEL